MIDLCKDYSREPVPIDKRKSWISVALIWAATMVCMPAFLFGVEMGSSIPLLQMLPYGFLVGLICLVLVALVGRLVESCYLATGQILRVTFGGNVSKIITLVLVISSFGWFGIQLEFFSKGIAFAVKEAFSIEVSEKVLVIIGGILMTTTGAIGYKALEKLSYVTFPVMVLVLIYPLFNLGLFDNVKESLNFKPSDPLPIGVVIGMYIGGFAGGIVILPDFLRYIKNWKHGVAGVAFAMTLFSPLMFMVMAFYSHLTGESDIFLIFSGLGISLLAILMVILSAWTTNDTNLYASALSLSAILTRWKKWQIACVAGTLGTILALFGILSQFMTFLIFIGIVMMPITATYVTDYFFHKERYANFELEKIRLKNWIALLIGLGIGISTLPANQYGLELISFTTIPPVDGFIASSIAVILINTLTNLINKSSG